MNLNLMSISPRWQQYAMILLILTIVSLNSCAKIYYSPEAKSRAGSHKLIAIAPPKVSIAAQKKVDPEAIKEQQKTESTNFQQEMYSWLLKRKMQNRIFVEVQDVATTNAKLKKAGYFDETPLSPAEICEALGVDGIITSNYSLTKPMSEGGAVALGLLVGFWGSTNTTTVSLEIHDKQTQKLLWNYNHKVSGSIGSTPAQLVDNLMRNASKNMPYSN
ncbi:MAG TPA: hypothetical protein PLC89_20855 [Haliscomenobacter sp.]|uniref:hypothetical protein n=1 Tax=Haliscomenobacter sp. TaxID=2717303 RepID=UPI001DB2D191|nr:hypothetical protein [Haliscomenobacter sp.]MBK9488512.1 hypothetical protein [Haliscomenobacter sp.]HOY19776.1 hypothetical protein [Haliscomenobacter sp.]HPH18205.1 hypothetical protein [Haliscomenobacter sp.]